MSIRVVAGTVVGCAVLFLCAGFATAQTSFSGELGYTRAEFSESDPSLGFNVLHARGGAQFTPNLGAELEVATGVGKETVDVSGFSVETKLLWTAGAYAVVSYPITSSAEIFARGGYVKAKLKADAGFGSVSDSADGYALGVGFKYFPKNDKNGVRFDYTRYDFDGDNANNLSVSYIRKF